MKTKYCCVCQVLKTEENTDQHGDGRGFKSRCKTCDQLYWENYAILNRQRRRYLANLAYSVKKGKACYIELTHKICKRCEQILHKDNFKKRTDTKKGLSNICLECSKKYHEEYNQKNKQSLNHKARRREKKKAKIDPIYRIKRALRSRIRLALRGIDKSQKTLELLGCSLEQFRNHVEAQFTIGMTWENYGKNGWELDHIIPCSFFNLINPEEQKKCFNYTNIQPLWATDNRKKSNKI